MLQPRNHRLFIAVLALLFSLVLTVGFQTVHLYSNAAQAKAFALPAGAYTIQATVTDVNGTWPNKISVLSFDTAFASSGPTPTFSPITITKAVDADTPLILSDTLGSPSIPSVLFEFLDSTGAVHHSITLSMGKIVAFKQDVAIQGKPEIETLTFDFVRLQYKQGTSVVCFDFSTNAFC